MNAPLLRVGIIGAGPVTQSIHLPAIARLADHLTVVRITDVDADVVSAVAGRVGATGHTDAGEMLAAGDLDIVAVCSPQHLHAEHVEAACRAGVGVVLCEKPFASSREEAERIARTVAETGARVVVGAMHTYDPAWLAAEELWGALPQEAHTVRSSIVMPGGTRFEDFATEVLKRAAPPNGGDLPERERKAARLRGVIYGLIIHDLPLVRRFAPTIDRMIDVRALSGGWVIVYSSAGRLVHLTGGMTGGWKPEWHFRAYSESTSLEVEFMPSYVWAGSARATVTTDGIRHSPVPADRNGYEGEWQELAAIARGEREPRIGAQVLIDDVQYAVELAEQTSRFLLEGASR
ncbi:hypothetical protein GCM10027416_18030 [Okibacterium endophyticum]